ncbi:PQQ-dependent sugar dehydrogenase [Marinobacterium sedimentorum]|uniref:PQQ-dependent sugar dehydrogenase n=1 Tax=Marinobacterium sedimentorum TaxID=2927804 RepID=UPI0020C6331E|nr:PQQ-dependent sugar dehydrogenase [Marinobacterium sedimentorum]
MVTPVLRATVYTEPHDPGTTQEHTLLRIFCLWLLIATLTEAPAAAASAVRAAGSGADIRAVLRDGEGVAEEQLLRGELGRIRRVQVGPDGDVYLLTDENRARLVRLKPAPQ